MLATVVEKFPADIFPDSVRAVQAYSVALLDFHNLHTAQALDAQHVSRNFVEAHLMDWQARGAGRARVIQ